MDMFCLSKQKEILGEGYRLPTTLTSFVTISLPPQNIFNKSSSKL